MHKRQKIGHNTLDLVGNIYLIAEKQNLVLLKVEAALDFGEIEHTGKVERKIYI